MSFIAGYLLGLGQGSSPPVPTPSPLSLEGIRSLKTLATVTVGECIFEIKKPCLFYGTQVSANDIGTYSCKSYWRVPVLLNNSFAAIQTEGAAYIRDLYDWYPPTKRLQTISFSDFFVTSVIISGGAMSFPSFSIYIQGKAKVRQTENGVETYYNENSIQNGRADVDFFGASCLTLTELSGEQLGELVLLYLKEKENNEPVINIL